MPGIRKFGGRENFRQFSKFQGDGVEEFSGSRGDGLCRTMTFSRGLRPP